MIRTPRVMAAIGLLALTVLAGCSRASVQPTTTTAPPSDMASSPTGAPASPTQAATPLGALTGTWQGIWTNTTPVAAQGTFTLIWAQVGGKLIGTVSVAAPTASAVPGAHLCLTAGNVSGTVNGGQLRFGAVDGDVTIDYDGTVVNADTIEGSYRSDCGPSTGTWTATRASV